MNYLVLTLLAALACAGLSFEAHADDVPAESSLVKQYPSLEKYLFEEPRSHVEIGGGVSPFGMMRDQLGLSASLFQFHYISSWLDWEVLNVSFSMSLGNDDFSKSRGFSFRTAPKIRLNQTFSIGPLLGYEFVSFPDLSSQIFNGTLATPSEPFSSRGAIYGGVLSETFPLGKDLKFKMNQVVYRETYSTTDASQAGWVYRYGTASLNQDQSPIAPGTVLMLEFSVLY